jgi:hypothetical protein
MHSVDVQKPPDELQEVRILMVQARHVLLPGGPRDPVKARTVQTELDRQRDLFQATIDLLGDPARSRVS